MNIEFEKTIYEDIKTVKSIYEYYIVNTTATFHIGSISDKEMENILFSKKQGYESYVIKHNSIIIGYVLLAPYKAREAYRRSAEVTIYITPEYTGKGIGAKALNFIEQIAFKNNFKTLLSIICAENINSISLFENYGYYKCGHLKNVGEKFGRILDIVIYEKEL